MILNINKNIKKEFYLMGLTLLMCSLTGCNHKKENNKYQNISSIEKVDLLGKIENSSNNYLKLISNNDRDILKYIIGLTGKELENTTKDELCEYLTNYSEYDVDYLVELLTKKDLTSEEEKTKYDELFMAMAISRTDGINYNSTYQIISLIDRGYQEGNNRESKDEIISNYLRMIKYQIGYNEELNSDINLLVNSKRIEYIDIDKLYLFDLGINGYFLGNEYQDENGDKKHYIYGNNAADNLNIDNIYPVNDLINNDEDNLSIETIINRYKKKIKYKVLV